jgi:hypothetical protein
MLQALFPWLVALFSLSLAYPWVRWLLAATHPPQSPPRREPVLILLLTVGLSLGALTWALLMLSALSKSLAAFWPVTVLMLIFHAGGWIVWRRYRQAHPEVGAPPGGATPALAGLDYCDDDRLDRPADCAGAV